MPSAARKRRAAKKEDERAKVAARNAAVPGAAPLEAFDAASTSQINRASPAPAESQSATPPPVQRTASSTFTSQGASVSTVGRPSAVSRNQGHNGQLGNHESMPRLPLDRQAGTGAVTTTQTGQNFSQHGSVRSHNKAQAQAPNATQSPSNATIPSHSLTRNLYPDAISPFANTTPRTAPATPLIARNNSRPMTAQQGRTTQPSPRQPFREGLLPRSPLDMLAGHQLTGEEHRSQQIQNQPNNQAPVQAGGSTGISRSLNQLSISQNDEPAASQAPSSHNNISTLEQLTESTQASNVSKSVRPPWSRSNPHTILQGPVLLANYFPITIKDIDVVYQYEFQIVKTQPPGNSLPINASQKARIVWLLMNLLRGPNNSVPIATNYKNMIIAGAQLGDQAFPGSRLITYYDQYQQAPPHSPSVFSINFATPQRLVLSDLLRHLSRHQAGPPNYEQKDRTLAALNIIFAYRPYKKCFVQRSAPQANMPLPEYTTLNGGKFYGVYDPVTGSTQTGQPFVSTDRSDNVNPDGGVKSILGFSRSVRPFCANQGQINLNINTTTALCYPSSGTVHDLIQLWLVKNQQPHHTMVHRLESFLTGLRVRTEYRNPQAPDYITSIAGFPTPWRSPPKPPVRFRSIQQGEPFANCCQMTAPHSTGTSVEQHFKFHYGVVGAWTYVLNIGNRDRPISFPAERLLVLPGQMMQDVSEKPIGAIRVPTMNRNLITKRGRALFYGLNMQEEGARAFHLDLGTDMLRVPVVRLAVPQIQYRGRGTNAAQLLPPQGVDTGKSAILKTGAWALNKYSFYTPTKKALVWTYVQLTLPGKARCNNGDLRSFSRNFERGLRDYGLSNFRFRFLGDHQNIEDQSAHLRPLPYGNLPGHRHVQGLAHQSQCIETLLQELYNLGIQLVVIILPTKDHELYSAIKRAADQAIGLFTICNVVDTSGKPKFRPDFFANLCLKANLKTDRRSVNQSLTNKPPILTSHTMIMGIDVTHPGANAMLRAPSVAAVVGSIDQEFAQWPASLGPVYPDSLKESKEEIDDLHVLVRERIQDYFTANQNTTPEKLIIYRDGLSEGQFDMCRNVEYAAIQKGLDEFAQVHGVQKPKVLLICAVKRHQTRLFPVPGQESNNPLLTSNLNPMPGTMVDDVITYGDGNDFFLISQKAIQGTARPTHYVILRNEEGYNTTDVAQMTHNLCYLFGRATRSVGVCPAAYYADLAADRARVWVRDIYNAPKVGNPAQKPAFDRATMDTNFRQRLVEHANLRGTMWYI